MKILAVSDIHNSLYWKYFVNDIKRKEEPDYFVLAGDITERNNIVFYKKVVNYIRGLFGCEIIGVFGNEEWLESRESYLKNIDIIWLEEKKYKNFVGTQGVLDKLTRWQLKNYPQLKSIWKKRINKIRELLDENTIFISHYSPTYLTLEGEKEYIWPWLGSKEMEKVVIEKKPKIVIHGHAHNGKKFAKLNGIPVYNVALPLNKRIVEIEVR